MRFEVTAAERKGAKHPHEIFLINLITNHILLFVGLLGTLKSFPAVILVVPTISFVTLTYILLRAKRALVSQPWYISCHWQIAARRSRIFIIMLAIMALAMVTVVLVSGGNMRPHHFALGGAGVLPTMLTVLILIVMEQDAMHQANSGLLPDWVIKHFSPPADIKVLEE